MGTFILNKTTMLRVSVFVMLVALLGMIAAPEFKVDLRVLQEATATEEEPATTDDGMMMEDDGTGAQNQSMWTDDPLCDNSVDDPVTGTYTDGSSGAVCDATTGYEACPCYNKCGPECQANVEQGFKIVGGLFLVWIALAICVPLTCCITIGCLVYHCVIKKKD